MVYLRKRISLLVLVIVSAILMRANYQQMFVENENLNPTKQLSAAIDPVNVIVSSAVSPTKPVEITELVRKNKSKTAIDTLLKLFTNEEIIDFVHVSLSFCKINRKPELIFNRGVQSMTEPPTEKRIWAKPSNARLSVAIVEPREHENLRGVLFNMAHVYGGTNTSLYIFHGTKNLDFVKKQIPDWQDVQYVNLGVEGLTYPAGYNTLMRNESIYLNFKSEFVLIFQIDSLVRRVIPEMFYEYDYIGAPWPHNPLPLVQSPVGNGGFSLRRVSAMLEICRQNSTSDLAEDLYISSMVRKDGLPTAAIANQFAAEMTSSDDPVGIHQIFKFFNRIEILRLLDKIPGSPML